jgi:HEAT repeat protein
MRQRSFSVWRFPGTLKVAIVAFLTAACLTLELVVHGYYGIETVYTHLFYLPIILAGIWFGQRALIPAFILAGAHISVSSFLTGNLDPGAIVRGILFITVALITGTLAPRIVSGACELIASLRDVQSLREKQDVDGLIRLLTHRDAAVQYDTVSALGDIGDDRAVEPLIDVLMKDQYSGVRWRAARALAQIGEPAVEPLIGLLSHPVEDIRWKAAIALGEIGDRRAIPPLIWLLHDHDHFVKGRAAHALGLIGRDAIVPLTEALSHGDDDLRWGAAIALGRIRDPSATIPLARALRDRSENVRSEAAAALAAIGLPAAGRLATFLQEKSTGECREMAAVLMGAECTELRRLLRALSEESDANFLSELVSALRSQGDPLLASLAEDLSHH